MVTQRYYPVSVFKLLVMSFFTFGFYIFYVWYRNWEYVRAQNHQQKSSFWRSFFMVFTVFSLFRIIDRDSRQQGQAGIFGCYWFAAWFCLSLLGALYVGLCVSVASAGGELLLLIVNYACLIALVPMQRAINKMNKNDEIDKQLSMLDAVIILLCLLLWALMIYVTFFAPQLLSSQYNLQTYKLLIQQMRN